MNNFTRRRILAVVSLACALPAYAKGFPERPIRLVIPFPAGSSTDIIARVLSEHVGRRLGQSIVVDNKPGADGAIAADSVRKAPADGYTLLFGTGSAMSGVPTLRKSPPYDPVRDFSPISDIGRYTFLLYVNAQVPGGTLHDFIAYAKAERGHLSYAYGNVTGQLAFASIAQVEGLDLVPVSYKGEPSAINDLMSGLVTASVATAGAGMPHVQSGKLKVLATILPERSPALPDVPTFSQAGYKHVPISPWLGLFGPPRMPAEVVSGLNSEFTKAMKEPEVIKKMESFQFLLTPSTPEALGKFVAEQLRAHQQAARVAGIKQQ